MQAYMKFTRSLLKHIALHWPLLQNNKQLKDGQMAADHGKEDAKLRIHVDNVSISKDELWATLLFTREDDRNLLSSNW